LDLKDSQKVKKMDLILDKPTPFAEAVSRFLQSEKFTLVDIGCAGGISPAWHSFGEKLRVFGFDPDSAEMDALRRQALEGEHTYTTGRVGLAPNNPLVSRLADKPMLQRSPFRRLAIDWWQRLKSDPSAPQLPTATESEVPRRFSSADISLPKFLNKHHGGAPVDFIKIDVDGSDLDILYSLDEMLGSRRVLGVGIEVNFFGSDDWSCNSFHNIDRFLRKQKFDLFDLSQRRYANRVLPAPSDRHVYPAETAFGRLLQGDALYARDLASSYSEHATGAFGEDSVLKLAAILSLFDLPDCAAELLVKMSKSISSEFVQIGLGLLAAQAQRGLPPLSYEKYIDAFVCSDLRFKVNTRLPAMRQQVVTLRSIAVSDIFAPPVPLNGSACTGDDWQMIATPTEAWAYALEIPTSASTINDYRVILVRLSLRVTRGRIAIGLHSHDRKSIEQEVIVPQGEALQLQFRTVAAAICGIVLRSAATEGVPSTAEFRLDSVDQLLE
jgi:hypothetical protein